MDTQLLQPTPRTAGLEIDLIGDLACPWSYLAKHNLEQALTSFYALGDRIVRWHGLPLGGAVGSAAPSGRAVSWRDHFATRLAPGASIAEAQAELKSAGEALGVSFDFERIGVLPNTREANRLVSLATRDGRQSEAIEGLFRAFFESGADLSDHLVLAELARKWSLPADTQTAFADVSQGRDEVVADEQRLRTLGVSNVPSVVINGRVLVQGPADASIYVQALDQALFGEMPATRSRRQLH